MGLNLYQNMYLNMYLMTTLKELMDGIKVYNSEEELDGKEFLDFRLESLTKDSFYDIMK